MGYAVIPDLIASSEIDSIARSIEGMLTEGAGTRRLIEIRGCVTLAERIARDERLRETLPIGAVAVPCTLFVKSVEKN